MVKRVLYQSHELYKIAAVIEVHKRGSLSLKREFCPLRELTSQVMLV